MLKTAFPFASVFTVRVLNGLPFRVSANATDARGTGPPLPLRTVNVTRIRLPCRANAIAETRSFPETTVTCALAVAVPKVATTLPVPGEVGTKVVELPDAGETRPRLLDHVGATGT